MEGAYRSDDSGAMWVWIGRDLPTGFAHLLEGEPRNARRLYCGTMLGAALSDDAGATWRLLSDGVQLPAGESIGAFAVDPRNVSRVFCAPGWSYRADWLADVRQKPAGARVAYRSLDRGKTWQTVRYDANAGDRNVHAIRFNPANPRAVYLSADGGVYASSNGGDTWVKLSPPPGTTGRSFGMDVSGDGKTIIAAYETAPNMHRLFVRQVGGKEWADCSANLPPQLYWRPAFDPARPTPPYRVLAAAGTPQSNTPLYLGSVTPDGAASWAKIFDNPLTDPSFHFDMGWNSLQVQCKQFAWLPAGVGGGGVFVGSQQSIYRGDPAHPRDSWRVVSTRAVPSATGGAATYTAVGIASTYNYDTAAAGNYVVQGQADNCLLESFDGGASWRQQTPDYLQNGDALDALPPTGGEPAAVLAAVAPGYGGGSQTDSGELFVKRLAASPADVWEPVVSFKNRHGLPPNRIWSIAHSASDPNRVYVGTHAGLYATPDIRALSRGDERAAFITIGVGGPGDATVDRVFADPFSGDTVYAQARSGVWRGVRSPAAAYAWTRLHPAGSNGGGYSGLAVWGSETGGKRTVYVAVAAGDSVVLSTNGAPFRTALTLPQAVALHGEPWYANRRTEAPLAFGGLAGDGDRLYVNVMSDNAHAQRSLSFLCGTVGADGAAAWSDCTGGEGFHRPPGAKRGNVVTIGGKRYLAEATLGAGLWTLPLP